MKIYDLVPRQEIEDSINAGDLALKISDDGRYTIGCYTRQCPWSDNWNIATTSLRGMVWETVSEEIVSRCMPKFFNHGQEDLDTYQNLEYEVFEKYDGSLIHFGYSKTYDELVVTTKFSFNHPTILDLVNEVLPVDSLERDSIKRLLRDSNITLVCELIHPENRIVVNYGDMKKLVILDIIDNETGESKILTTLFPKINDIIFAYSYGTFKGNLSAKVTEILEQNKDTPGNQFEGFVFRFEDGRRIKVKMQDYIYLHRIITNMTPKSIIDLVVKQIPLDFIYDAIPDEWITYAQELSSRIEDMIKARITSSIQLHNDIIHELETWQNIFPSDQNFKKQYAAEIQKSDTTNASVSICFRMADALVYPERTTPDQLEQSIWHGAYKSLETDLKQLEKEYEGKSYE